MTSNCWDVLELAADSDERSVKRRYAQLLKHHRPDESPTAFQALREAYEQALAVIRWRLQHEQESAAEPEPEPQALSVTAAGLAASMGDALAWSEAVAPEPQSLEAGAETAVRALLAETSLASLDAGLAQAEAGGYRAMFEQGLLELCLSDSADAMALTEWALRRLNWLTPWQTLQLAEAHGDYLLGRWLWQRLQVVKQTLTHNPHSAAELILDAAQSPWLSSFDRQNWFQQQLVQWLLDEQDWSPAFFQQLTNALGWHVAGQEPPCLPWQWQQLRQRCDEFDLVSRLRRQLVESWPYCSEVRAAWLLLKPLTPGECRKLVEHFDDADWQACAHLSDLLEYRYQGVLAQLSEQGLRDWRVWQPGPGWNNLNGMIWLLFLLAHGIYQFGGMGAAATRTGWSALIDLLWMATAGLLIAKLLYRGWGWLARSLTAMDVKLSKVVLTQALSRQGTGILLLRHGVAAAGLGMLSASMSRLPLPYALLFAGAVFGAGLAFVHYTRRLPTLPVASWLVNLVLWWRANKTQLLIWLAILLMFWVVSANMAKPKVAPLSGDKLLCEQYTNKTVRDACVEHGRKRVELP